MRAAYGPNCVWSLGPEISVWVSEMRQTGLVTVRTGVEMGWVMNEGGITEDLEGILSQIQHQRSGGRVFGER